MTLVDSSVWIDYFRGYQTPETSLLDALLQSEPVVIGDLILTEVLQGFDTERELNQARKQLNLSEDCRTRWRESCHSSCENYRTLRALGLTVRKTIDTIIATRCIGSGLSLLYSKRNFDAFVEHLGLRSALANK